MLDKDDGAYAPLYASASLSSASVVDDGTTRSTRRQQAQHNDDGDDGNKDTSTSTTAAAASVAAVAAAATAAGAAAHSRRPSRPSRHQVPSSALHAQLRADDAAMAQELAMLASRSSARSLSSSLLTSSHMSASAQHARQGKDNNSNKGSGSSLGRHTTVSAIASLTPTSVTSTSGDDDRADAAARGGRAHTTTPSRRSRRLRLPPCAGATANNTATSGSNNNNGSSGVTAASPLQLELRENITTEAFIAQKRDIGLVRMSLATKRAEMRKLEEEVAHAEKQLQQQQDQLESTREKFASFLKHSNLEQDAAVRRADSEAKAKQEKAMEMKKLSARIHRTEESIKKMEARVESCMAYRNFLDDLTKPRWFAEVLTQLRVEDASRQILADTEAAYAQRAQALVQAHEEQVAAAAAAAAAAAQQQQQRDADGTSSSSSQQQQHRWLHGSRLLTTGSVSSNDTTTATRTQRYSTLAAAATTTTTTTSSSSATTTTTTTPAVSSLDEQLAALHAELAASAQAAADAAAARIAGDVAALSPEAVKAQLHSSYDEARLPVYFTSVDQLLEVFINVEEGNLFLIQNCQELEEELEGVAMDYLAEQAELKKMTEQRQEQMRLLTGKIHVAQAKLTQLEERAAAMDTTRLQQQQQQQQQQGGDGRAGGGAAATTQQQQQQQATDKAYQSPEAFKVRVEHAIVTIFRLLTSGDNAIKSLTTAAAAVATSSSSSSSSAATTGALATARDDGSGATARARASGRSKTATTATATTSDKTPREGATANAAVVVVSPHAAGGKATSRASKRRTGATARTTATTTGAAGAAGAHDASSGSSGGGSNEAAENMGPIEMLTIIENKLEEYHRYIAEATNGVDANLIQAVMKQNDKERRRYARLEHMAQQAAEQEERMRRALLRAQAPIQRRTGRSVLRRSHIGDGGGGNGGGGGASARHSRGAFDGSSDPQQEDGSEFFR